MDLIVFNIDDQQFALDLNSVERVIRIVEITPLPNTSSEVMGAINMQGEIVPTLNTRKLLEFPERDLALTDNLIICKLGQKKYGLWVDGIQKVMQVNQEDLTPTKELIRDIKGSQFLLKDKENIVLLYDLNKMIENTKI